MDPGQDLDDEMSLVLMRALEDRHLVTCVAVVAVLAPSAMRAQLAAGTMRQLGMYSPVGAGSDGGAKGDTTSMVGLDYMARGTDYASGMEVMRTALKEATPKSLVMLVISSLKDTAQILREEEALCCSKFKQVVIMGGVKPFEAGAMLEPDTAHNNMFDFEAAQFVYRRCQELGIPLLVVSRHAAYSCTVPRRMYDELAATGSHIGKHLQMVQRSSIERLWQRAASPEGSAERAGLPARCDKQWFATTFCAGKGAERDASVSIWDLIVSFNMYDPIAMLAAVPSLESHFIFDETQVNGVCHRVVGSSPERTGVADGPKLAEYMTAAFMHGICIEQQRKDREREMVVSLFHSLAISKYTVAQLKSHVHLLETQQMQQQQQQAKKRKIPFGPKHTFFFGVEKA